MFLGKNVFANHNLTIMSLGTVTIEDGVMLGPEVGIFTVNHEPKNIRTVMTKEIYIKKMPGSGREPASCRALPSAKMPLSARVLW